MFSTQHKKNLIFLCFLFILGTKASKAVIFIVSNARDMGTGFYSSRIYTRPIQTLLSRNFFERRKKDLFIQFLNNSKNRKFKAKPQAK